MSVAQQSSNTLPRARFSRLKTSAATLLLLIPPEPKHQAVKFMACAGAQPSFQPSDSTQGTTKSTDSEKPTHTQKRSEKSLQTAHPQFFLRNFSLSLTRLLYFLSPHSSPFCRSPSTVRERLSRAVTAGSPVGGNPATRPHAFPGTTNPGQRGGSMPPSHVPSPPGKGRPFSPDQFSPVTCKARLSTLSSRKIGRRKAVTFGPRFAVAVPIRTFWATPSPHVSQIWRLTTA